MIFIPVRINDLKQVPAIRATKVLISAISDGATVDAT
jgi:hypothetical protein